jgi:ABC-type molybdate transport system substrate-binding protein
VAENARVTLYSTGVLRAALRDASAAFTAQTGIAVEQTYGNTGKLRERILNGEPADVFGAGDVDNPQMLHDAGAFGAVTVVAHAPLALLVKSTIAPERSVADIMLDPAVRLVTGVLAPPKIDPAGDYAEIVFARIDERRPGSYAALNAKALQLAGGGLAVPPGADLPTYLLLTADLGDAFLAYGSNFVAPAAAHPEELRVLPLPPELALRADFGLALRNGAPPEAVRFRDYLLSDDGQAHFVRNGFTRA